MTHIHLYRDARGRLSGFSVIGHAGSAPAGEDIVCAGISALAQAAANALHTVAHVPARVHIRDGVLSLRLSGRPGRRRRYAAQVILKTAEQGFADIAAAYPEYVRMRGA